MASCSVARSGDETGRLRAGRPVLEATQDRSPEPGLTLLVRSFSGENQGSLVWTHGTMVFMFGGAGETNAVRLSTPSEKDHVRFDS